MTQPTQIEIAIVNQSDSQVLTTKVIPRNDYISDHWPVTNAQRLYISLKLLPFDTIIELGKLLKADYDFLQIFNIR